MRKYIELILTIYISVVFIQSLFFKFNDAPETIHIFHTLGDWAGLQLFSEYGAYSVGIVELIASVLLLFGNRFLGALLATGTMAGAVFFHLFTPLGIKMPEFDADGVIIGDDGGLLFYNACGVLAAAIVVAIMRLYQGAQELPDSDTE